MTKSNVIKKVSRLETYVKNKIIKQAIEISIGKRKCFYFHTILLGARFVYLKYDPIIFDNVVASYYYKYKKIYSQKLNTINRSKNISNLSTHFHYVNIYRLSQYVLTVDIIKDLNTKEIQLLTQSLYIATWYSNLDIEDNILVSSEKYKIATSNYSIKEILQHQSINIILKIQDTFDISFVYILQDINKAKDEYNKERKRLVKKIGRIKNNKTIIELQHKYSSINVLELAKFLIFNDKISLKSSNSLTVFEDILKAILNIRLFEPYINKKDEFIKEIYINKYDPNNDTKEIIEILNNCKQEYNNETTKNI